MLQAIREKAQGWIAWVIVILISIPFALWGIQEYLGVGSEPVAVTINGTEITVREVENRMRQVRQELRDRQGAAYDPDRYPDAMLKQQVLDEMIREQLILMASVDMGLRAGDNQVRAAIEAIPAFQVNGRFDVESFKRALSFQGKSAIQFEQQVRGSLMTRQLSQMVEASEFVTGKEKQEAHRLLEQQRRFDYILVPAANFEGAEPSDADVQSFYDERQAMFRSPERVKVNYLVLDSRNIPSEEQPSEDQLRQLYEERKDGYGTPEQRRARHILVMVSGDADEAAEEAARQQIAEIRERIVGGEDFAALAAELSQDPGSASSGGDLGFFEKGIMDPAFETAAFSQQQGEVGEPVRSSFGYHLIEVTDIQTGSTKPFEEVRDELLRIAGGDDAERRYFELAERLESLTYENPDSLEPAAEALGLTVQRSDWLTRQGGEGVFADPKVMNAAFAEQVLHEGYNSDPVQIEADGGIEAVVVRMYEYEESTLKPLDEVRDTIVSALSAKSSRDAAAAEAEKLAEALEAGQDAVDYTTESVGPVKRNDSSVAAAIVQQAFTQAPPAEGGSTVGVVQVPQGSAVVVLREVIDGEAGDDDQGVVATALSRAQARAYYDQMVEYLRGRAEVRINRQADES
jgi:peptidyl-prolyl cis-trans isomerase D